MGLQLVFDERKGTEKFRQLSRRWQIPAVLKINHVGGSVHPGLVVSYGCGVGEAVGLVE